MSSARNGRRVGIQWVSAKDPRVPLSRLNGRAPWHDMPVVDASPEASESIGMQRCVLIPKRERAANPRTKSRVETVTD